MEINIRGVMSEIEELIERMNHLDHHWAQNEQMLFMRMREIDATIAGFRELVSNHTKQIRLLESKLDIGE